MMFGILTYEYLNLRIVSKYNCSFYASSYTLY